MNSNSNFLFKVVNSNLDYLFKNVNSNSNFISDSDDDDDSSEVDEVTECDPLELDPDPIQDLLQQKSWRGRKQERKRERGAVCYLKNEREWERESYWSNYCGTN